MRCGGSGGGVLCRRLSLSCCLPLACFPGLSNSISLPLFSSYVSIDSSLFSLSLCVCLCVSLCLSVYVAVCLSLCISRFILPSLSHCFPFCCRFYFPHCHLYAMSSSIQLYRNF